MHKMVNGKRVELSPEEAAAKEKQWEEIRRKKLAVKYRSDRQEAYPDIGDQMDMIYWDAVNGTHIWKDTVAAVKDTYPKP